MGIDGESQDSSHGTWIDEGSSGSPAPGGPAPGGKRPRAPGSGSNLVVIVFGGLMLLGLVGTAVLANDLRKRLTAPEEEEIVFEPEVVSLDDGSIKLNASYSTSDSAFFHTDGEDEIPLSIVRREGTENVYDVRGTLNSVQNVGIDGMDKGQPCTVDITHEVTYTVKGTFSAASCTFELSVSLAPTSSQLVGTGCSVDINLDPSALHIEPRPDKLVFTSALASQRSEAFSFYLFEVSLPSGANCPALSNP